MSRRDTATKFFVSRQQYYYSGTSTVEVTAGGLDYAGADMLRTKYRHLGESEEYTSAVEAVKAAIAIRDAWIRDYPAKIAKDISYILAAASNVVTETSLEDDWIEQYVFEVLLHVLETIEDWNENPPVVAFGFTWGGSLELEGGDDDETLLERAQKADDNQPKCDRCGEPRFETWTLCDDWTGEKFCSEYCADQAAYDLYEDMEELDDEWQDDVEYESEAR